jgi:hypothetical protein
MWGANCGVLWLQPSSIAGQARRIARPAKHSGHSEALAALAKSVAMRNKTVDRGILYFEAQF